MYATVSSAVDPVDTLAHGHVSTRTAPANEFPDYAQATVVPYKTTGTLSTDQTPQGGAENLA